MSVGWNLNTPEVREAAERARGHVVHSFQDCLEASNSQALDDFWEHNLTVYFHAWKVEKVTDVEQQRLGIDWKVWKPSRRIINVDDKNRWKNKKTGKVYSDILLELLSDADERTPGWVVNKRLQTDYIAYAIHPLAKIFMLPAWETQRAWEQNKEQWLDEHGTRECQSEKHGRVWTTLNCPIPERTLYQAIGAQLRRRAITA